MTEAESGINMIGPFIISLIPLMLMQIVYVLFVIPLAKRREVNLFFATIMSLIPAIGFIYVMYTFYRSWLMVMDGIADLKTIAQTR